MPKHLSSEELAASLEAQSGAISDRIRDLTRDHSDAALAFAEGDTEASKRLTEISRELKQAQSDFDSLEAAYAALQRRRDAEVSGARSKAVETNLAAIPGAVEAAVAITKRLDAAIAEVGSIWAELKEATEQANSLAWEVQAAGTNGPLLHGVNRVELSSLQTLAGHMLYIACKDEIHADWNGRGETREGVLGQLSGTFARLPIAAQEHARKALGKIRG